MHNLDIMISDETTKYSTKITILTFLSELCKKLFTYPELISSLKSNIKELKDNSENILIFSMLLNIFKTDQTIKEYENKKMVKIT